MPGRVDFPVVVATDGSRHARAAIATALEFPWPPQAVAQAVVARRSRWRVGRPQYVLDALDRHLDEVAAKAGEELSRRWPGARATVVDASPVEAILAEARRVRARTIVLGWRGHGQVARLLMGSVSRGVVRDADCPVLVVRRRCVVRTLVVGLDGSRNARAAAEYVASLSPGRGRRAVLVRVVEPVAVPSAGLLPSSVVSVIGREASRVTTERITRARQDLTRAAGILDKAGWTVQWQVRVGLPLRELFAAVRAARADLLCVGARGVSNVEGLLLGSVADGALNRCPVAVLVVR